MSNHKNKWLSGAVLGAITGAIGGLLLAPRSGKETRKLLKKKAEEMEEGAKEAIKFGSEKVKDTSEKAIKIAKDKVEDIKDIVNKD